MSIYENLRLQIDIINPIKGNLTLIVGFLKVNLKFCVRLTSETVIGQKNPSRIEIWFDVDVMQQERKEKQAYVKCFTLFV